MLFGVTALQAKAQKYELGAMLGASNYHGDLAYNVVPKESNFSGGLFLKYNINEHWSMRPTLSYMKISGADSNFSEYEFRNLSFRNRIFEVSNIMEFNFQPFSNNSVHGRNTFYVLGGIAGFVHKPEALLNDKWYDLRSAQTENVKYRLMQISVPFGGGFKQAVGRNLVVGLEAGWRYTFTDHLDDVSSVYPQIYTDDGTTFHRLADRSWEKTDDGLPRASQGDMRGDPNLKDWYFQTAFTITYRFTPILCPF
ncbi:MAG: DUF6089 family protein [Bacteroidia bacterium]